MQGLAVLGPKREVAHLSLDAAEIAAVAAGHDALLKNLVEHGFYERPSSAVGGIAP